MSRTLPLVLIPSLMLLSSPTLAQSSRSATDNPAESEITDALDQSIEHGLAYLSSTQNDDGSWEGGRFGKNVAITSLACLAMMGDGDTASRGPSSDHILRGVEFILDSTKENGLIAAQANNGPMYGHGFAMLFLGEVYGMTGGGPDTTLSTRIHEALVRGVRLIEQTQNEEGGWRYNPVPYDADVSVTICQIMALRSARNAGIEVSSDTIDRAVEYVRNTQNPDGGFRYQNSAGSSAWPRSAAGIASLYYSGIYSDDSIDRGLEYLMSTALPGATTPSRSHYFYGQYYAVQSMFLAGGEHWETWWPAIREELLDTQLDDGGWDDRSAGKAYATAMSLIILQMPKRYLPIFQK
jgi:Prenyltransferase and squalene oxidase repeat